MTAAEIARFRSRVDSSRGPAHCWPFRGVPTPQGYGRLRMEGRTTYAHRVALALALGRPVGKGMQACHICDNPICCNPLHLYEGTSADNHADMTARGRGARGFVDEATVIAARSMNAPVPVIARSLGMSLRTAYRVISPEYRPRKAVA